MKTMVLLHDKLLSANMTIFYELLSIFVNSGVTNLVLVICDAYFTGKALAIPNSSMPQCIACSPSPHNSGGFRGVRGGAKCTPLWWRVMYFCVHNCTSPSNDYAGVACSNNNQASYTLTHQFLTDLHTFD